MVEKREVAVLFGEFEKALKRLEEAILLKEETDIKRDAVIQRFEFTFEILWKVFRRIARLEKMDCYSPKSCFKIAFNMGLIDDEDAFSQIIDARNKTVHTYSEEEAKQIYDFVRGVAISAFKETSGKIEQYLKNM
ncbi:MAG TPA: DUF86 domain-containing protein [candidate division WOR-3 bacterium]|uniref:DUF86 domain-containing protein n=1 Tax=candidate division WOR-3 bacterium TaxID=2052148 RepID=A0A7C5DB96_UNCW3|nr:DUF86 domain-containing protein [candidate division WOR-3 bacterium]